MVEVYNSIDIVVLPSWREGLSKSLLEAAAMSMPIITTNVPGCNYIIKNNFSGLLVKVRSKAKLKSALKILLNNQTLADQLGRNAREIVSKKYKVEIINKQILDVYNHFLQA